MRDILRYEDLSGEDIATGQESNRYDDNNWTKEDTEALDRHFTRLQEAAKSGELILAGRTKEPGKMTFGIVIFTASDEAAARKFMESDPAVVARLMTAELHPFAVAVQGKALSTEDQPKK